MRRLLVPLVWLVALVLAPLAAGSSHEPQCPDGTETWGGETRAALQVDTAAGTFYRWMKNEDTVISRETNGVAGLQDTARWCVNPDRTFTVLYEADERVLYVDLPCAGIILCIL